MNKPHLRAHLFHILPYSVWPILSSISAFYFVSGFAFYLHNVAFGGLYFFYGLVCLLVCTFGWFSDIVDEATFAGYHTRAVRYGLRLGFILFMASEVMLFFGFFWAFFHSSISPVLEIGSVYPPFEYNVIEASGLPLFNTFILIISGLAVTWTHRAICLGFFKDAIDSLLLTIFLGYFFVILQMYEYNESLFDFSDGIYSSVFFMLTGLHGCHVVAGAVFLTVNLFRLVNRHFLRTHYLGFVFAVWYWHLVDGVWIFLYLSVYVWGNWASY